MGNISKAVATVAAVFGLSGCATMSDDELTCLMSALGGAAIGAAIHEDEKKGALIGATVGALGCSIYKHLNERQIAEMAEKEAVYLSSTPIDQPIDIEFSLVPAHGEAEGPAIRLRADSAVAAEDGKYCRPIRREVVPMGDQDAEPQVFEPQIYCVDETGHWAPKVTAA